eukprot:261571_1
MSTCANMNTVWITHSSTDSFLDSYTKGSQIGQAGAYGTAFMCKRKVDGTPMVVKEISKKRIYELPSSSKKRQSIVHTMKTEIEIMRLLKHPYIAKMRETYETTDTLYIVMEQCKGGELFERLIQQNHAFSEEDTKRIIRMVCEALFYMHNTHNVVHLDLKPENILFMDASHTSHIKLIDFGVSKILSS